VRSSEWSPVPDPDGRFSSGIPDFDRLLGGGFARGSTALFAWDETVTPDDLDLLLFPTYLNMLYHSRGIVAVLPARDGPSAFRARLARYVTRRRFDSRVRLVDYVGEDAGAPYVVTMETLRHDPTRQPPTARERRAALAKMVNAEKAVQGQRGKPFTEITAFEVFETLLGAEPATRLFYFGIKRTREIGNLGVGLLGPGLGCAAAVRRMVDTEFELRREEMGLVVRGIRPAFPSHVVAVDRARRAPYVSFVPRPA